MVDVEDVMECFGGLWVVFLMLISPCFKSAASLAKLLGITIIAGYFKFCNLKQPPP